MLTFTVPEEVVYGLLPGHVQRPNSVVQPNKGGVTRSTYEATELRYNAYIQSQLLKASVPVEVYANSSDVPVLLRDAQAHLIAASISRIFDNPQNPYKDLYATGNILLREYIEVYQLTNGTVLNAPEFTTSSDVDLSEYSFTGLV